VIGQLLTAPNQLTLLRLVFIPFIIINVVDDRFGWALVLFILAGLSDGLDGLLARALNQRTVLGQYLDPIADKLLMSSLFLVLSLTRNGGSRLIPWKFTILVFSRDICILVTCAVLWAVMSFRDFRPSVFGKANTLAEVLTVFTVLLYEVESLPAIYIAKHVLLWVTFALTLISGIHYVYLVGVRMHAGASQSRTTTAT
jgi:cardiolipin synthase